MKKTLRRVVAFVVCLALMAVPMQFTPVSATTTTTTQPMLAYVPLDDRPVVWDRVVYAAKAAGFDIKTPEYDLIRTRLDNQGFNDCNNEQFGDGESIMDWLEERDDNGCDLFIVHLDMMFSGGLVGSRYPKYDNVTDDDKALAKRLLALANKADNKVYFIDILMRLASTGGYRGYDGGEYDALRAYGAEDRLEIKSDKYSTAVYADSETYLKEIYQKYQIAPSGSTIGFKSPLTQAKIDLYHQHRLRKMQLMNMMIQDLPKGTVYMVGIDDATPGSSIQSNERNFLYARMEKMGLDYDVLYDTDSCGLMMLARVTNDYYHVQPKVKVRYFGPGKDLVGDEYSDDTLEQNVNKHLVSMNAQPVASDADIEFLVLTKPSVDYNTAEYVESISELVAAAKDNTGSDPAYFIPTIIVDASACYEKAWNSGYTNLQDELVRSQNGKAVGFGKLLFYSNWNTVGNAIGIALGAGISRYTYLRYEENIQNSSHIAHAQSLTYAYIKDISYLARNKVYGNTGLLESRYLYWMNHNAGGGGWNNGNFYQSMINYAGSNTRRSWTTITGIDYREQIGERYVNAKLEEFLVEKTDYTCNAQEVLARINGSEMYTNLNRTMQTQKITSASVRDFRFPWFRTFELTFEIDATIGSTKYHYYSDHDYKIYDIPFKQTGTTFINNLKRQHGITQVTAKDWNGADVTSGFIGTGFDVTMTFGSLTIPYKTIIPGEVTGDGRLNTSDVRAVMYATIDSSFMSAAVKEAADFNSSGGINSTDARQILQVVVGNPSYT